jgi:hypothetical protein
MNLHMKITNKRTLYAKLDFQPALLRRKYTIEHGG